jgi:hypothetical protein
MHSLDEVVSCTKWTSGISPVKEDWLAHLVSHHDFYNDTWVKRLIHVCNYNVRACYKLAQVQQIDAPRDGFCNGYRVLIKQFVEKVL